MYEWTYKLFQAHQNKQLCLYQHGQFIIISNVDPTKCKIIVIKVRHIKKNV